MIPDTFLLTGGLDTSTSALAIKPGRSRAAMNYEMTEQGYARMDGIESYDGQPSPSSATFDYLRYQFRAGDFVVGDTLTGGDSAATGAILVHEPDPAEVTHEPILWSSGEIFWSNDDILWSDDVIEAEPPDTGYLILHNTVGTLLNGEAISAGAGTATTASAPLRNQAPTPELAALYLQMAQEARRDLILEVPGTGRVRGVAIYQGTLYAWRNSTATCKMWKATSTGWTEVDLGSTLSFTAGTTAPQEGEVFTRGSVTATVMRVVVHAGSWDTNDAVGYMAISGASGTFAAGAGTTPLGGAVTVGGPQTPFTIPLYEDEGDGDKINQVVRSTVHDFGQGERLYVATGVSRAYEFDGVTVCPIKAPLLPVRDLPIHIAEFGDSLWLFFPFGAAIFSEIGDPLAYTTTGGGGTLNFGSAPRDVIESANGTLFVICRTKVSYVTGTDSETFAKVDLSADVGGWGGTAQNIGRPIYLDQRGLRDVTATDTTAGFRMGTLSNAIARAFVSFETAGVFPMCSILCRAKDQYRAFMSDGSGVSFYFGRDPRMPEPTTFEYPVAMTCAISDSSAEQAFFTGTERMYTGGIDGRVYALDKGTSYDGEEIDAFVRMPFNMLKSPSIIKRFHSVHIDISAAETTVLGTSVAFDYDDEMRASAPLTPISTYGGGGYWDEALLDEFNWSSPISGQIRVRVDGSGKSLSLLVTSKSATEQPHVLTAARINWTARKYDR